MLRACSLLGMTVLFLVISPGFRGTVLNGIAQAFAGLDKYSPYSYAGVGLALVGGLMATFYKSSVPR